MYKSTALLKIFGIFVQTHELMNRIILIGNGFDLAHGLPTSYKNFIDWYWGKWETVLRSSEEQEEEDVLCSFRLGGVDKSFKDFFERLKRHFEHKTKSEFCNELNSISTCVKDYSIFLSNICKSVETKGWVDIENEYYNLLNQLREFPQRYNFDINSLNNQFGFLQELLIQYLSKAPFENIDVNSKIKKIIYEPIRLKDVSISGKNRLIEHLKYWAECDESTWYEKLECYNLRTSLTRNRIFDFRNQRLDINNNADYIVNNYPSLCLPDNIMLLNFNYTNTANKYVQTSNPLFEINHIHGELSNPESIIFGYGDELDENYKKISNLNNNEYLTNFKSIKYLESDRYRKALQFMDVAPYQVLILGHSCGNSDRTLLNTLFEHKNCVSIKPYYYKHGDKDNYLEIVQNISRNFTDMKLMRDKVVNKTYCEAFSVR